MPVVAVAPSLTHLPPTVPLEKPDDLAYLQRLCSGIGAEEPIKDPDSFIEIDNIPIVDSETNSRISPKGKPTAEAARGRARRSEDYREARAEYAAIRELRERNWIAAHIRERRYELDLTQQEVAERAGTSHSFISKLEGGEHIPTIPVLKRILAVLDEELLIGIERQVRDEEPEREVAPVPELASA
jgi:ribosome-binding protein aMBF1 (putative translation factor)